MHETGEDLRILQGVLDASRAAAGEHLRSIFTPDRDLTAEDLSRLLTGAFLLNVACVTSAGAPLVAPVDGLFFRGKVWFGFPPGSVRGRILRERSGVGATHTRDAEVCIVVHGEAREVPENDPGFASYETYLREVYGPIVELSRARYEGREGTGYTAWIEPRRFFATRPHPEN